MKLYGTALSPYVARVLLVVRHKGLEVEPAEAPGGSLKSAEYLAINPYGKMPALEHEGAHIIESEVICEYLEEIFPTPPMLGGAALDRARIRTLSRAADLYVMPALLGLLGQMNPTTRDPALVEEKMAELKRGLDGLDRLLIGPYSAGPDLTLADAMLVPACFYLERFLPAFGKLDGLADHPKISGVWSHLKKNPTVAALVSEMSAALDAFMRKRAANA